jgi:hypothetical protein
VRVDDPRVLVGRLRSGGLEHVLFVNSSADAVEAEPVATPEAEPLVPERPLRLAPYSVAVSGGRPPAEGRDALLDAAMT